jgi:uncharacterized protein YcbX
VSVVAALHFYPVKSCRGVGLERATLEARGLRHDRRWMLVDDEGRFLTQREEPRLALVGAAVDDGALVLSAPGRAALRVPLVPTAGSAPRRRVRVWKSEVEAVDLGPRAASWMAEWLGRSASLVHMPDDARRAVNPEYAREGDIVSFADGYPLLVVSESSLEDLAARLGRPIPMNRFRPNVVVRGFPPWAEDGWRRIRIGAIPMRVCKPSARCVVTTVDQSTGERGDEPLRTLATFRKQDGGVMFGQNCAPDALGEIAVGDAVTIES